MQKTKNIGKENRMIRYRSVILLILFIGIFLLFFIFSITMGKTVASSRQTDNKIVKLENKGIRGRIISKDGFIVSYSEKKFRAEINTRSIDPKKKNLFIKLFAIYSGLSQREVTSKFFTKSGRKIQGRVVLTDNIDYRLKSDLKSLSYKMGRLHIFRPLNPKKPHIVFGLDILPDSETRFFPNKKLLTPVVGYVHTEMRDNYRKPKGVKGLERAYDRYLEAEQDGLVYAKKDIHGVPLLDGENHTTQRIDGMDLHLNIPLSFQKDIEAVVTETKKMTEAQEVMVAVMDSTTGKLYALASSERFDPKHIRQRDVNALHPKFSEYLYEPGSVIKPFTMAIALDHGKVDLNEKIPLGGKLKVTNNYTISDDDYFKSLTPKGIIMHSSNIGIAKIAWRLTGMELYEGWRNFGLSKPSGVDLSRELIGRIKSASQLNHKIHSANMAYGYGMLANFMQLVRGYSAFNNDGVIVTPKIVDYMTDQTGKRYEVPRDVVNVQACSAKTAHIINKMLQATVNNGTGRAAQYDGLIVGGKTGTAHISERGHYVEKYHSSFYGFANDKLGDKFTIGVFVIKPKRVYFASQTAAPTFKKIVGVLVKHNYLVVDKTLARIQKSKRETLRARKHALYLHRVESYSEEDSVD